jgi:general nucleoside transport system permease protein
VVPLTTVVLAFIAAGLVMILTGTDPLGTYGAIFNGTGLNWLFPWVGGHARVTAAEDLQQTLVATAPLILTGLSVAFAFRVGLFNIGAQGQYTVGAIVVVWVATSWNGLNPVLHIIISIGLAALISAFWAAIAGWLKAAVGTHEVISTIMLNWIAIYVAQYLFQEGGPLQGKQALGNPVSNTIAGNMHLPVFWGNPQLQGLDVGIFISLFAAVVFWAIMHRSTLGYEVRAVGHNPTAAQGAGISVARNYIVTMAICGAFAGLAACVDVLGWQFQVSGADITTSQVGFLGIAVALLGRNTAIGTVFAALLFGALETGTSTGNLTSTSLNPELAPQLTYVIEGLIVLLVSTDVIAIRLLGLPRKLGWGGPEPGADLAEELEPDDPALDAAEALRPEGGV